MKIYLILILFASFNANGQISYLSKTSFKFSDQDGWVRIIEKEWFTVNSNGDTTFWEQIKEDTQQEDPGIIKNSVPVLIPSSIFKIGREIPKKDTIQIITPLLIRSIDTVVIHYDKPIKPKVIKKTRYKTIWKNRKPKIIYIREKKQQAPPPKKIAQKVKAVLYEKKLWCVLSKANTIYVVEANTAKGAMRKLGTSAVQATEFSNYSIIR